ncbi:MAG TPA: Mur ligase family protein, partial [Nitriliruptoraceae bacterium]|nr:Mur ligase family protein [Nitriliruptoraceae bacterium]
MDPRNVDFDHARAGLYARGQGRMVPDLDRITALVDLLGEPQATYPTIHVTGTNGKTSTTRMTAGLLSELGLTTGTFTSPHLQTVRERFQVGLQPISEDDFARTWCAVEAVAGLVDADAEPDGDLVTFFEVTAAIALWRFADLPVDVAVVDVGMGGRWDATNVVDGDVAVLTP